MDFSLPKFERIALKETNSKDVNQLFKYVAEIGFGTYGFPIPRYFPLKIFIKVEFIKRFLVQIPRYMP